MAEIKENPAEKERLSKLIRLLSSDKDGEVLASVRAIERTLKAHGKSFHDLADAIVGKVLLMEIRTTVVKKSPLDSIWVEACDALISGGKMNDVEQKFVVDMYNRFKFNPDFQPSRKQAEWFRSIVQKHEGDIV